jgi:thioredoxin reductase
MAAVDVLVVGVGPYGLSLASQLSASGIDFCLVGDVMGSWKTSMPDGMFLKSEGFASNIADPRGELTLREFCLESEREYADYAWPVPIETFREYGEWFFARGAFPHCPGRVVELGRDATGFAAKLDTGAEVAARAVVVATGISGLAYVPPELATLPEGRVSHTSSAVDVAGLARRDSVIVGGGQSALELAALLLEQGATPRALVRRDAVHWNPWPRSKRSVRARMRSPRGPLGDGWRLTAYAEAAPLFSFLPRRSRVRIARETLGPGGAWWLRERVEPYGVVHVGHRIVSTAAIGRSVLLRVAAGGAIEEVAAQHVVAATGYRADVRRLPFLDAGLLDAIRRYQGAPVLSRSFESSVPGLFFVGLLAANTFGPVMRFVCGTSVAAERVSRGLRRRLRRRRAHASRWTRGLERDWSDRYELNA